jgi:RecT family
MSEPNPEQSVVKAEPLSVARAVGARFSMEADALLTVLAATVFPKHKDGSPPTKAELTAFLAICYETGMNPFTREIFAYVAKSGNIETIISVDGWLRKLNEHPKYQGMEITEVNDEKTGKPISITAIAYRSDREKHTPITEYYAECYRDTEPWKTMPHRMMRNKVIRQVVRFTFGFAAAVVDEDYLDEIHVGSGLSESLANATQTRTETLKEKIGAKTLKFKGADTPPLKVSDPAPKTSEPEKTQAASVSGSEGAVEPVTPTVPEATGPEQTVESGAGPAGESSPDPEAKISKIDRENLVNILMSKQTDPALVVQAAREKLKGLGYEETKDVKNKDYPTMVRWAESWNPPADVSSL